MYDIFVNQGCTSPPDLHDLREVLTADATSGLSKKALLRHPGFLGIDATLEVAHVILGHIESAGGRGLIVPSRYRQPTITVSEAFPIAQHAVLEKISSLYPNVGFGPVKFLRIEAMFFVFGASSEELAERDIVPGAVFASVDKVDGHVWGYDEFEQYIISTRQAYWLKA
jgi:hypothetical protein